MMKKGMIQDFMLETDSPEVFEQYLRLTVQVSGVRCIEKKGYRIGGLAWEYPSESVWQEMDDALLTRCPELYWLVCRLSGQSHLAGSGEYEDEDRLVDEVMALLAQADRPAYGAADNNPFADAEGLSGVGYRLHVSGYSGMTVSLCRIFHSK